MKSLRSIRSKGPLLFALFLILLAASALTAALVSPRHLSTSFTSMIPQLGMSESMAKAENVFTGRQNSNVNLFVSGSDFTTVRSAAIRLYSDLGDTGAFEEISLDSTTVDSDQLFKAVSDNVYSLLDSQTRDRIVSDPVTFQNDSLASIFSAFTVSSLSNLDSDPFLLSEPVWMNILGKVGSLTTLAPKDGVLCTQVDGIWYVMISGVLSEESQNLTSSDSAIDEIFRLGDSVASDFGVEVSFSGLAFHSHESASGAQREMTIISVVSVVLILLMFFLLCRNFHILWLFLLSLTLSVGSAACALLLFFKDIHVLSMIFGTSLIGTCIDYSIHSYICAARKDPDEKGFDIRKKIGKSLTLSFISTELCYFVLLFSSYGILRQMAVISLFGLLSSYLAAMVLYPRLITDRMINRRSFVARPEKGRKLPFLLPWLAIASTVLVLVQIPRIGIHNDITSLYTPSERMLRSETNASKALGYLDSTYAIIEGASENDALETELLFTRKLDDLEKSGLLEGYIATVSFVPPRSEQDESLSAAKALLPYLDEQCDILGIDETSRKNIIEKISGRYSYFTIASLPDSLRQMIASISLGEIDGKHYEVVIIRNVSDASLVSDIASSMDGVQYIQTAKDTSAQLDHLSAMMFRLFIIAVAAIVVVMVLFFGWRKGLSMSLAPYTILTGTIGVLTLAGLQLDFFVAVGLVLIVGLGLDYMVFASNGKSDSSKKAVLLSFLTTELSFGSLMFSSFRPVHIFGLTVFVGILIAYICTIGAGRK
ncbi:MAG: MMPL family transporter [Spirochaetales bacterium]|nr:MMPL family transporter [Spirochaetales bacterium]